MMRRWRTAARRCALWLLPVAVCRIAAATEPPSRHIRVGDAVIDVSIVGALPKGLTDEAVAGWVDCSAHAVASYVGRFPVPHTRVRIRSGRRRQAVGSGVTFGGDVPSIRVALGPAARPADLRDDWVLTHEMVHLMFPDLTSDDSWAEEGLATFVEPLARVHVGTLSEEQMWNDLIEGLPKGLPGANGGGLHGTQEWGRTYWGGTLFWLLADIEIRQKTRQRQGLPDALSAILAAGGDIRAHWSLPHTLRVADKALGLTVLSDLYARFGVKAGAVDLRELWRRLGVRRVRGRITYDASAPLAEIRRAIASGPGRR